MLYGVLQIRDAADSVTKEAIVSFKLRKTSVLLVVLVLSAAAALGIAAACGGNGGGASTEMPTFTYAASGGYPPFSMMQNGKLTGFDIELGQLLAKKMGMKANPVTNPFETIIEGLNAKKYDAVIGSLAITPERQQVVDFTIPYYTSGAQLYVAQDNTTITGPNDLAGAVVGTTKASTYLALAQKLVGKKNAIGYDADTIALQDLLTGRVDAAITDQVVGGLAIKKGLAIKAVGTPMETTDQAIAVRKDEPELLAKLNKALEEAKADGSYKALSEKWLGQVLLTGVQ